MITFNFLKTVPREDLLKFISQGTLDKEISLISKMSGCEQSHLCHAEGDVAQHTSYVFSHAQEIITKNQLTLEDQTSLLLSALLHDWGKPFTQQKINGEIQFPGHEEYAAIRLWKIIENLEFSLAAKETTHWLVANHGKAGRFPQLSAQEKELLFPHPAFFLLTLLHQADHGACYLPPFDEGKTLPIYSSQMIEERELWSKNQ